MVSKVLEALESKGEPHFTIKFRISKAETGEGLDVNAYINGTPTVAWSNWTDLERLYKDISAYLIVKIKDFVNQLKIEKILK